jgi:hypothetical protein
VGEGDYIDCGYFGVVVFKRGVWPRVSGVIARTVLS